VLGVDSHPNKWVSIFHVARVFALLLCQYSTHNGVMLSLGTPVEAEKILKLLLAENTQENGVCLVLKFESPLLQAVPFLVYLAYESNSSHSKK
jgi:hypothetical protein